MLPPGPPVAGDFAARLLKLPIHALGLDEAALLARQLPNLGTLLRGVTVSARIPARRPTARRAHPQLVQGHPKLIELAEVQAADIKGLADHLERAEAPGRQKEWEPATGVVLRRGQSRFVPTISSAPGRLD